jgi:hypothetical protein
MQLNMTVIQAQLILKLLKEKELVLEFSGESQDDLCEIRDLISTIESELEWKG